MTHHILLSAPTPELKRLGIEFEHRHFSKRVKLASLGLQNFRQKLQNLQANQVCLGLQKFRQKTTGKPKLLHQVR